MTVNLSIFYFSVFLSILYFFIIFIFFHFVLNFQIELTIEKKVTLYYRLFIVFIVLPGILIAIFLLRYKRIGEYIHIKDLLKLYRYYSIILNHLEISNFDGLCLCLPLIIFIWLLVILLIIHIYTDIRGIAFSVHIYLQEYEKYDDFCFKSTRYIRIIELIPLNLAIQLEENFNIENSNKLIKFLYNINRYLYRKKHKTSKIFKYSIWCIFYFTIGLDLMLYSRIYMIYFIFPWLFIIIWLTKFCNLLYDGTEIGDKTMTDAYRHDFIYNNPEYKHFLLNVINLKVYGKIKIKVDEEY